MDESKEKKTKRKKEEGVFVGPLKLGVSTRRAQGGTVVWTHRMNFISNSRTAKSGTLHDERGREGKERKGRKEALDELGRGERTLALGGGQGGWFSSAAAGPKLTHPIFPCK